MLVSVELLVCHCLGVPCIPFNGISFRIPDFDVESEEDEEEVIRRRREQRQAIVRKYNGSSIAGTGRRAAPPETSVVTAAGIVRSFELWILCQHACQKIRHWFLYVNSTCMSDMQMA